MTTFILAAAALAALALLVLLRPWWPRRRAPSAATASREDLNTAIYRDQLAELERDRAAGQIADADYAEARAELQRRLLEDVRAETAPAVNGAGRRLWIALALAIPLGAGGLYALIGTPTAMLTTAQQHARAEATMEKMVAELAQRLEVKPDNPEGWVMLARSYAAMGRMEPAAKAFARVGPALETQPALMVAYADFLVRQADGDFSGKPRELIRAVLAKEPENMTALYLAGADAMQAERWKDAVRHWEPLLKQLEPGSEDAENIAAGLEHARKQLGGSKAPVAGSISGRLELAPALAGKAAPEDTVFLFARAEGGPPMPLAARKLKVADLPYRFTLSDADALGGAKLSEAKAVRIEARVAKGGTPAPQPGDLSGRSNAIKPGARNLTVRIDTEVR